MTTLHGRPLFRWTAIGILFVVLLVVAASAAVPGKNINSGYPSLKTYLGQAQPAGPAHTATLSSGEPSPALFSVPALTVKKFSLPDAVAPDLTRFRELGFFQNSSAYAPFANVTLQMSAASSEDLSPSGSTLPWEDISPSGSLAPFEDTSASGSTAAFEDISPSGSDLLWEDVSPSGSSPFSLGF